MSDIVDVKSPAQIRAEKIAAAMEKLGSKHVLHKSHQAKRQERQVAHADVRKTFDRLSPGWNQHDAERFVPLDLVRYRGRR